MNSTPDMCSVFEFSATLPSLYAAEIWNTWGTLDGWQHWDASLKATKAENNGLSLGKRFEIMPVAGPGPIPVCVTALVEEVHFTTTAQTRFGLLSFGHTLSINKDGKTLTLSHSILSIAKGSEGFPPPLVEKLKNDVVLSVKKLAEHVQKKAQP